MIYETTTVMAQVPTTVPTVAKGKYVPVPSLLGVCVFVCVKRWFWGASRGQRNTYLTLFVILIHIPCINIYSKLLLQLYAGAI